MYCSKTEAHFTAQSRILNETDKCTFSKSDKNTSSTSTSLKSPHPTEEHTVACSGELSDLPLDLCSQSKHQKNTLQFQKILQADSHLESKPNDTISSRNVLHMQTNSFVPTIPYAVPDTVTNGVPPKNSFTQLNHQVLEPSVSWTKISTNSSVSLLGTYVGIANPVLASTLRSKDGKVIAFMEDLQNSGRPEIISIIDQEEQLISERFNGSSRIKDSRQRYSKCSHDMQKARIQQCQYKHVSSKLILGSVSTQAGVKDKLSSGKQHFSHSPKTKQSLPHSHLGASSQKKKESPELQISGSCPDSLCRSSLSMVEEKWEKTKSCLFKLETVVKQGSLDIPSDINKCCCNQAATYPGKHEEMMAEHQDCPVQQKPICTSLTNERIIDGRLEKYPPKGTSTAVTKNIAEPTYNITEKYVRGENREGREYSEKSRCTVPTQVSSDCYSIGKDKKEFILWSGEMERNGMQVVNSLSPNSQVEGIALSVLKGQCTQREISRTNIMKESSSTEKVAVKKNKKSCARKQEKPQKEASRKTTLGIVKSPKKMMPIIKRKQQTKKQKKQLAPILEPKQPEAEMDKRQQGSGCSFAVVEKTFHIQAGDVSSPVELSQSIWDTKVEPSRLTSLGRPAATRSRKGRGRAPRTEPGSRSFSVPCPTPRLCMARCQRGRPHSRSQSKPAKWDAKTATRRSEGDVEVRKKRERHKNRRYRNEEYIMGKDQVRQDASRKSVSTRRTARGAAADLLTGRLCPRRTATVPVQLEDTSGSAKRSLLTRSGSSKCQDTCSIPKPADKPSGKRKFKTKHLSSTEDGKMVKTKRRYLGKRSAPTIVDGKSPSVKRPASLVSSVTPSQGRGAEKGRTLESSPGRTVPPEVRRLIVNKNAGETMLQRAARLGYKEVVLYCLEKDARELNRRDNAGYTALHEACARGWTDIVRVLLDHGADVNCGAQDGTRPIHDAVISDNLTVVWLLLNHGADPTLATYSGQTTLSLAQSSSMKTFLMESFADQEGRPEPESTVPWDFYSSVLFESEEKVCWDYLLSVPEEDENDWRDKEEADTGDCLLFEFSDQPHIPCYHVQVSLFQGYRNWFLLSDVLRRLRTSARLFQAQYPQFEVVGVPRSELYRQVSASQLTPLTTHPHVARGGQDSPVQLVQCVPDLQRLLGSTVHCLPRESLADSAYPHGR